MEYRNTVLITIIKPMQISTKGKGKKKKKTGKERAAGARPFSNDSGGFTFLLFHFAKTTNKPNLNSLNIVLYIYSSVLRIFYHIFTSWYVVMSTHMPRRQDPCYGGVLTQRGLTDSLNCIYITITHTHPPPSNYLQVKVAVLGAAGGIGQPISLLIKSNPLVTDLALYDIVNTPGVAADLSHINTPAKVCGILRRFYLCYNPILLII